MRVLTHTRVTFGLAALLSLSLVTAQAAVPFDRMNCNVPAAYQEASNIVSVEIRRQAKKHRLQVHVKRRNDYYDIFTPWIMDDECPTSVPSSLQDKNGNYLPLFTCYRQTRQGPVQVQTTAVNASSITWLPHNATESRVTPGSRYEIIVVNSPTKSLGNDRKIFRMLPEWCEVINWPAEGAAPTEQAE